MSQAPPPPGYGGPPGYPPQPFPPQQPGYYGQQPPGGFPSGPKQGNGAAVASLVFGIFGCVPFVGVIAILLGIVGLQKTKDPRVGGKGMAIAGLILGILTVLFYIAGSVGLYAGYKASLASRPPAEQFLKDLAAGNITAAAGQTTSDISASELQSLYDNQLKAYGPLQSVNWQFSLNVNAQATANGPKTNAELVGEASFANGAHQVIFTMDKQATGWKVQTFVAK